MTINLTIQPDPSVALDLSVHGNDVEVTTREEGEYGVVVRLPLPVLRAALGGLEAEADPAGSYTRTVEDSGVAAEALTGSTLAAHFRDKRDMERARAEKAEQERDDWKRRAGTSVATSSRLSSELVDARARAENAEQALAEMTVHRDQCRDTAIKWQMEANRTEQARPVTPDDITDEMVQRLRDEERALGLAAVSSEEVARSLLAAALTEPPAHPEGAEDLAELITEWDDVDGLSESQRTSLTDFLAERGVRVTGAES